MTIRRAFLLAVFTLAFDGCGGSSGGSGMPFVIWATGGVGKSKTLDGIGGAGAKISIFASGLMKMDSNARPPKPKPPLPPKTGTELTNAMITAGTPIAGNVLVSSTLQIAAGVNPAVITSSSGDVVIKGSLIGERSGGAATNGITISAPAGTIYVLGSVITRGTAGAPDNPGGGPITLTAQRIVVQGTIDAGGLTRSGAAGGNGGAIVLDTTGGGTDILTVGGKITSVGGGGSPQGGTGGAVTLHAGNQLSLHSQLVTTGGEGTALGVMAVGGAGGAVTLKGDAGADIDAAIDLSGGNADGFVEGAMGGTGGTFTAGTAAPYILFGSIRTSGGEAEALQVGSSSFQAGDAGPVNIGVGTPLASVELGRGRYSAEGGPGISAAGDGGAIDIASLDGNIVLQADLNTFGADASNGAGGAGSAGTVSVKTDADPSGNTTNHTLTLNGNINAYGGSINGGNGAGVVLQCGGDLTLRGNILTSAFDSPGAAGPVSLQISAANTTALGKIDVLGDILAEGAGGLGGDGKDISLNAVGDITVEGKIQARGRNARASAGSISILSSSGNLNLTGSFLATPGQAVDNLGTVVGNFTASAPGSITFSGMIDVSGGSPLPGNSNVAGTDAGTVSFTSTGTGSITIQSKVLMGGMGPSEIRANGGFATAGSGNPSGAVGGNILFSTVNQPIDLTAKITARGGDSPAAGGVGGRLVVNSDSNANGTGGAITLEPGSVVDVSGGTGLTGGAARNNGGVAPADSSGTNLAVVLDAAGGLTGSPDGGAEGIVRNLGIIIAKGGSLLGRGGDIWFDGQNAVGGNLGSGDGGMQTLTSPAGNGAFFPN